MKLLTILFIIIFITACASHGPFVMNLQKEKGKLTFQECNIYINGFWGTSETQNCRFRKIDLK